MAVLSHTEVTKRLPVGDLFMQTYSVTVSNTGASDEWIKTSFSDVKSVLHVSPIGTAVNAPVAATATVTFSATDPTDEDTITVDGIVYTIQGGSLTNAAYDVDLDVTEATMAQNFAHAINRGGTPGTTYADSIAAHPAVYATVDSAVVTLTARVPGTVGNAITLAESSTGATVSGAKLSGGLDTFGANFILNAQGTGQSANSTYGSLGIELARPATVHVTVLGRP